MEIREVFYKIEISKTIIIDGKDEYDIYNKAFDTIPKAIEINDSEVEIITSNILMKDGKYRYKGGMKTIEGLKNGKISHYKRR